MTVLHPITTLAIHLSVLLIIIIPYFYFYPDIFDIQEEEEIEEPTEETQLLGQSRSHSQTNSEHSITSKQDYNKSSEDVLFAATIDHIRDQSKTVGSSTSRNLLYRGPKLNCGEQNDSRQSMELLTPDKGLMNFGGLPPHVENHVLICSLLVNGFPQNLAYFIVTNLDFFNVFKPFKLGTVQV